MGGTYVNVPDLHAVNPTRKIGLREYNSGVLVHNWFESRADKHTVEIPKKTSYNLDYKHFPDAKPDVALRRKLLHGMEGHGTKNLIGHHNFDSSKNMITIYDEQIGQRARPGPEVPQGQQFPEKRKWEIINAQWKPEKIDYPLQSEPTNWGLGDKHRNAVFKEHDKYASQLPNLSEYNQKFQKHPQENYMQRSVNSVPIEISTSHYDLNKKMNNMPKTRNQVGLREPQARDFMDIVYHNMLDKSNRAPRTYYYLGKVPTDGTFDAYSMKDFETLAPKY